MIPIKTVVTTLPARVPLHQAGPDTERRVLFVIPPTHTGIDGITKNLAQYKEIPYGILSIIAYVQARTQVNVQFKILDMNLYGDPAEQLIRNNLDEFQPDIVGVSGLFTSMFNQVREVSEIIKAIRPQALLVVGGNVSTNCHEELFKYNPYVDAACFSEGEIPMLDLINAADPQALLDFHQAWITREKYQNGFHAHALYVEDLDDIPPLDFGLLDLDLYDTRCRNNNPFHNDGRGGKRLPFISSRGCPFKCVFCAAGSLSGTKMRYMSPKRFLEDVRNAVEKFGLTKIVINDDQALLRKDRMKKILAGLAEMNLILEFPSGLNVKFIDAELAHLFKAAGLEIANLAIESGSERVLKDIIDKPMKVKDVRPAVDMIRGNGLLVHGFFIFGFVGETEEDRQATIDLIRTAGIDWANIYAAAPIRGSRLYQICKEKGFITDDSDILNTNIYQSDIRTCDLEPEELTRYVYRVNLDVNFINNYRLLNGDYDIAIGYFSNVVNNHPEHAFAHYALAKAYKLQGGHQQQAKEHIHIYQSIVARDPDWAARAKEFGVQ
ncbi:MAG: cobalamin-dependent protein [Candidatus Competibacteraceae bacterium]|nr:cobalamin-dependent protein [Candidatus Competibacteraceae bacterium]